MKLDTDQIWLNERPLVYRESARRGQRVVGKGGGGQEDLVGPTLGG